MLGDPTIRVISVKQHGHFPCPLAYDARALDDWLKQKCVGHLLRNLSKIGASKIRGAVRFARNVTALLREAMQLPYSTPHPNQGGEKCKEASSV